MDQMNVSITDQLAGYVRKKVKRDATTMRAKSSAKRCDVWKRTTSAHYG